MAVTLLVARPRFGCQCPPVRGRSSLLLWHVLLASNCRAADAMATQSTTRPPQLPRWITKNAYKRAVNRALHAGSTQYRGQTHTIESLQALRYTGTAIPQTRARPRVHLDALCRHRFSPSMSVVPKVSSTMSFEYGWKWNVRLSP